MQNLLGCMKLHFCYICRGTTNIRITCDTEIYSSVRIVLRSSEHSRWKSVTELIETPRFQKAKKLRFQKATSMCELHRNK